MGNNSDQNMQEAALKKRRCNALRAKYIHSRQLVKLTRRCTFIDFLAISVPIMFLVARYIAKNTAFQLYTESIAAFFAGMLMCGTIAKWVWGWQHLQGEHKELISANHTIATEIEMLLLSSGTWVKERFEVVMKDKEGVDARDTKLLAKTGGKEERWANRMTLLEEGDASVVCPVCHASPYLYKQTRCFLWWKWIKCLYCGNVLLKNMEKQDGKRHPDNQGDSRQNGHKQQRARTADVAQ